MSEDSLKILKQSPNYRYYADTEEQDDPSQSTVYNLLKSIRNSRAGTTPSAETNADVSNFLHKAILAQPCVKNPRIPHVHYVQKNLGVIASFVLREDPRLEKTGTIAFLDELKRLTTYDAKTGLPIHDLFFLEKDPKKTNDRADYMRHHFQLQSQAIVLDGINLLIGRHADPGLDVCREVIDVRRLIE